ncbi:MAG: hypothetical protein HKN82_07720 [Akkermansiaceae bacterium]|nr:hypothetical protein [Akkermansiaceae bacterium]
MTGSRLLPPLPALCRGDRSLLDGWLSGHQRGSLGTCVLLIVLGCGAYGYTIGLWRGGEMALYVAVKLPAVILLTVVLNGLLNGMLSLVLGSGIGVRRSLQFLLTAFAIMAVTLGALSPVALFQVLNTPPPGGGSAGGSYTVLLLTHTSLIAFAGIVSHRKLLGLLRSKAATPGAGTRTFVAWLAGNLFVGAQVSFILRPYFGIPGRDVEFLRADPLQGNFYEAVYHAAATLCGF